MRVADLALCKELYALSGWKEQYWWYVHHQYDDGSEGYYVIGEHDAPFKTSVYPAYDVEYLLEMLPPGTFQRLDNGEFKAIWRDSINENRIVAHSHSKPANALCRLAIDLFKAGVMPDYPVMELPQKLLAENASASDDN